MPIRKSHWTIPVLAAALLAPLLMLGCNDFTFRNLTSALGTGAIGQRDNVRITVFNRTAFRAIFTLGMYNSWDQESQPVTSQFANGDDGSQVLEGNTTFGPISFQCDRTLGIGSDLLLDLVRKDDPATINEAALAPGVGFSSAPLNDPLGVLPTEGSTAGIDLFQGAEFPCDSEVLLFLEENPPNSGVFVISFELITPP